MIHCLLCRSERKRKRNAEMNADADTDSMQRRVSRLNRFCCWIEVAEIAVTVTVTVTLQGVLLTSNH